MQQVTITLVALAILIFGVVVWFAWHYNPYGL